MRSGVAALVTLLALGAFAAASARGGDGPEASGPRSDEHAFQRDLEEVSTRVKELERLDAREEFERVHNAFARRQYSAGFSALSHMGHLGVRLRLQATRGSGAIDPVGMFRRGIDEAIAAGLTELDGMLAQQMTRMGASLRQETSSALDRSTRDSETRIDQKWRAALKGVEADVKQLQDRYAQFGSGLHRDLKDDLEKALDQRVADLRAAFEQRLADADFSSLGSAVEEVSSSGSLLRWLVIGAAIAVLSLVGLLLAFRDRISGATFERRLQELSAQLKELLSSSDPAKTSVLEEKLAGRFARHEAEIHRIGVLLDETSRSVTATRPPLQVVDREAQRQIGELRTEIGSLAGRIGVLDGVVDHQAMDLPDVGSDAPETLRLIGAWVRCVAAVRSMAPDGGLDPALERLRGALSREVVRATRASEGARISLSSAVTAAVTEFDDALKWHGAGPQGKVTQTLVAALEAWDAARRSV